MKNKQRDTVSASLWVRRCVVLLLAIILCLPQVTSALAPSSETDTLLAATQAKHLLGNMYSDFNNGSVSPEIIIARYKRHAAWQDHFRHVFYLNHTMYIPVLDEKGARYIVVSRDPEYVSPPSGVQLTFDFEKGLHADINIEVSTQSVGHIDERMKWRDIAKEHLKKKRFDLVRVALLFASQGDYDEVERFYAPLVKRTSQHAAYRYDADVLKEVAFLRMASTVPMITNMALDTLGRMEYHAPGNSRNRRTLTRFFQLLKTYSPSEYETAKIILNRQRAQADPEHGFYRGYLFILQREWKQAQEALIRSLREDATDVYTWRLLAKALEEDGQRGKARWIGHHIARGVSPFTTGGVEVFARALKGQDAFMYGGLIDKDGLGWEYDPKTDVITHTNEAGSTTLYERQADATFAVSGGGTAPTTRDQSIATRDAEIAVHVKILKDAGRRLPKRFNAAHELGPTYLATAKGQSELAPIIHDLGMDLIEMETPPAAKTGEKQKNAATDEEFSKYLRLLEELPSRQSVQELVYFIVTGPPNSYRAYATKTLAEVMQKGWPREWMEAENPLIVDEGNGRIKTNLEAIQDFMQEQLLSEEAIGAAMADENEGKIIFYNLTKLWEGLRSPALVDYFLRVMEEDAWPYATTQAGEALKNSWVLYAGDDSQRLNSWISRLKSMAIDENRSTLTRALAVGALAGVKEEALGVAALTQLLGHPKTTSFLRLKILETASVYAKRGDLSTLSLTRKIDAAPLILFLKEALRHLKGFPGSSPASQIGVGMLPPGEKAPTLNVVDISEFYGFLLSILIRDNHAEGDLWTIDLNDDVRDINHKILAGKMEKGETRVTVISTGAMEKSTLKQVLERQDKAQEELQTKAKKLFKREHRRNAFPLFEYYGLTSDFGRALLEAHDSYLSFMKGLHMDLPLIELEASRFAEQETGKRLLGGIRTNLGDYYEGVRDVEAMIQRARRAQEEYGLATEKEVLKQLRAFYKHDNKWFKNNPYAFSLWQRTLFDLSYSVWMEETNVDSPVSRRYTRIKLLHATEVLSKDIYNKQFRGTGAVTVDDRWMFYPGDIFNLGKNYAFDVTRVMHEQKHWLRGSSDIGMLGAAVTYGRYHELLALYFRRNAPGVIPPIEVVLEKILKGEELLPFEEQLVSDEFREGVRLAYDLKIKDAKTALLRVFHHFEWPVDDWPWEEIVEARRRIFTEIIQSSTVTGKKYTSTDTYVEGGKLAGYIMGLSARFGVLEAWPVFAELLAEDPEKYFSKAHRKRIAREFPGIKLRRLNPAEIVMVVQILGGLGRDKEFSEELNGLAESTVVQLQQWMQANGIKAENSKLLRRRVARKIEDKSKEIVLELLLTQKDAPVLQENASYEVISAETDDFMAAVRAELQTDSLQKSIFGSVRYEVAGALRRPSLLIPALWDRFDRRREQEQAAAASL